MANELDPKTQYLLRRRSRRSFLVGGAAALGGAGFYAWLKTRSGDDEVPWPLRRVLEFNDRVDRGYFNESRLAPTFDPKYAGEPKVNGDIGMDVEIDPDIW